MKKELFDAKSLSPGDLCIPFWPSGDEYTYVVKPDKEFEFVIGRSFRNENNRCDVFSIVVKNGIPRIERFRLGMNEIFIHGIKL